jgi:GWxTD domain-containing protein
MRLIRRSSASTLATVLILATLACGGRRGNPGSRGGVSPRERTTAAAALDPTQLYRRAGFLASTQQIPFIGDVKFFAGAAPDSTFVLVTLSLSNRALTFAREGGGYRAGYQIGVDLKQSDTVVRHAEAREQVRVTSFKETSRSDESIIFQQFLTAAPGVYALTINVRDGESARTGSVEKPLTVPRLARGAVSSPTAVYEATPRVRLDSAPHLIASPKATAVFGRDTSLTLYLEAYDSKAPPIGVAVRNTDGLTLWSDSLTLPHLGSLSSGVLSVPVARIGVGLLTLTAWRTDAPDTVRTPLFVALSDELAIASFDEMLDYLRYFTTPERLRSLRDTTPEARPAAWLAFLRATDPVASTPEHEALRDYFARLDQANQRFREEGTAGWLTDRGMVYVTLGEPDQIFEPGGGEMSQRGRAQIWQYSRYRVQLFFIDQSGFGRWRLTSSSEGEFNAIARRERAR